MTVYPTCDFPLLDNEEAIATVLGAVRTREPFSLIRINDGEAVALSFGPEMYLQDLAYLHSHWGAEGVSLGDVDQVKEDLQGALLDANVVGVRDDMLGIALPDDVLARPGPEVHELVSSAFDLRAGEVDHLSVGGARRLALLHRVLRQIAWSDHQRFCSVWIHWELLATGALNRILDEVDEVGLITSRPELEYMVARRFGIHTSAVVVPDKFAESGVGGHVPDRYRTIRSDFDFPAGSVVLVGAGIPGKVYCQWLKESGCVAIDVGAVFDAWIGKASRPRVLESRFQVTAGDSVPRDLQLHVPPSDEHHRLVPRWKPKGVPS